MSHNDERIVIKFDDHGEKKFVTPMVMSQLKKSDRQPRQKKGSAASRTAAAYPQGEEIRLNAPETIV
jgi:hypothetical protein